MRKKILIIVLLLSWLFLLGMKAQTTVDTAKIWRIVLLDGNEFYGTIIQTADTYIMMNTTSLGELRIPKEQIKKQEMLDEARIQQGAVWLENLQATRYFWAPNGYGLQKGDGYYQNVWVLFNQASYGVTDYFSVGAGTIPLFLFDGAPTPVFVVPKFSFPIVKDKVNAGVGVIAGTILSSQDWFETEGPFGIAYGVVSAGNKDQNFNVGVGLAFAEGETADAPVISLGAMKRLTRRTYLITENYIYPSKDFKFGLISLGGRTVWQRISVDYGGVIPVAEDLGGFFVFPWLGFSVPFQL